MFPLGKTLGINMKTKKRSSTKGVHVKQTKSVFQRCLSIWGSGKQIHYHWMSSVDECFCMQDSFLECHNLSTDAFQGISFPKNLGESEILLTQSHFRVWIVDLTIIIPGVLWGTFAQVIWHSDEDGVRRKFAPDTEMMSNFKMSCLFCSKTQLPHLTSQTVKRVFKFIHQLKLSNSLGIRHGFIGNKSELQMASLKMYEVNFLAMYERRKVFSSHTHRISLLLCESVRQRQQSRGAGGGIHGWREPT